MDRSLMDEDLAAVRLEGDKAVALLGVEPLDLQAATAKPRAFPAFKSAGARYDHHEQDHPEVIGPLETFSLRGGTHTHVGRVGVGREFLKGSTQAQQGPRKSARDGSPSPGSALGRPVAPAGAEKEKLEHTHTGRVSAVRTSSDGRPRACMPRA